MGNSIGPRQLQRGYLLEIPIMLFIVMVVLAVLMPRLSLTGQKVLLVIAAAAILFCLFCMVVMPGWVPGSSGRGGLVWRIALFLGCAAAIVAGVGTFVLR
jgi:hypothetical protein